MLKLLMQQLVYEFKVKARVVTYNYQCKGFQLKVSSHR